MGFSRAKTAGPAGVIACMGPEARESRPARASIPVGASFGGAGRQGRGEGFPRSLINDDAPNDGDQRICLFPPTADMHRLAGSASL